MNIFKIIAAFTITVMFSTLIVVVALHAQPRAQVVTPETGFYTAPAPELVRPQARPSDLVEIDEDWMWAHTMIQGVDNHNLDLDEIEECIDGQSDGLECYEFPTNRLTDTDLAVMNALGGEDI